MARYNYIDTTPQFWSVDLARCDARLRNDTTGAPAYLPVMLLKAVRFAYSQGIVRSRAIERVRPSARDVYRVVRLDRAARHQHRARCQHAARRHRPAVCRGAGGV